MSLAALGRVSVREPEANYVLKRIWDEEQESLTSRWTDTTTIIIITATTNLTHAEAELCRNVFFWKRRTKVESSAVSTAHLLPPPSSPPPSPAATLEQQQSGNNSSSSSSNDFFIIFRNPTPFGVSSACRRRVALRALRALLRESSAARPRCCCCYTTAPRRCCFCFWGKSWREKEIIRKESEALRGFFHLHIGRREDLGGEPNPTKQISASDFGRNDFVVCRLSWVKKSFFLDGAFQCFVRLRGLRVYAGVQLDPNRHEPNFRAKKNELSTLLLFSFADEVPKFLLHPKLLNCFVNSHRDSRVRCECGRCAERASCKNSTTVLFKVRESRGSEFSFN